jgi:hypothetical protein
MNISRKLMHQDINELYDLENDPGEMEKLKAETGYFDPDVYKY